MLRKVPKEKQQKLIKFRVFQIKNFQSLHEKNDWLYAKMLEHQRVSEMDDNWKDSTDCEIFQ